MREQILEDTARDQLTSSVGKNGQQIGRENADKVRAYIDHLRELKQPLPSRGGKPNWTVIAFTSGLKDRGVLYNNEEARKLVEEAVNDLDIGIQSRPFITEQLSGVMPGETHAPMLAESGRLAHTQRRLDVTQRRVQALEKRLAEERAAYEALKHEYAELKDQLRKYEIFEEAMTHNGRRFIP